MFKSIRCAVIVGALGCAVFACTAGAAGTGTNGPLEPQQKAEVTSPTSGMKIGATISAVTLGEECAATPAAGSAICPAPVDGGSGDSAKAGPCGGGGGGSFCQQSNVQIAFNAGPGNGATHVEIVSVALLDSASGQIVGTLTSSKPQAWSGNGYAAWDQTIKAAGDLKASYDLTAPAWSKMDSASGSRTSSSYSKKYKLHVTLRIDGVEILLESTDLNREPLVST